MSDVMTITTSSKHGAPRSDVSPVLSTVDATRSGYPVLQIQKKKVVISELEDKIFRNTQAARRQL